MASFVFYDIIFLLLFSLFVAAFLYKNRKNLQIENKFILLYRTKMGLDAIDYIGKKHPKLLTFLSDFVIIGGYVMMLTSMVFFFAAILMTFIVPALPKIPPVIPLLPYVDRLLPTGTLPPFYFTYWIIVIGVVAVCHEFAHGIFAKLCNVKIKSTGFGFIGPLLAAFVEIDEKQMAKRPIKSQLAVLAAGSTANLLLWILFFGIGAAFFTVAFMPNGVHFSTYATGQVNLSEITQIDNYDVARPYTDFYDFAKDIKGLNKSSHEIWINKTKYHVESKTISAQYDALGDDSKFLNSAILVLDSPAYKANLSGDIQEVTIENRTYGNFKNVSELQAVLTQFGPGQELKIKTTQGNYTIVLANHPENSSRGFLGIGFSRAQPNTLGKIINFFSYKEPSMNYSPKGNAAVMDMIIFIYHLLYWLTMINFFIMMFNMLPVGIVDGGRFFYLTALAITKSEKRAEKWFTIITYIILLGFLTILGTWAVKAFF